MQKGEWPKEEEEGPRPESSRTERFFELERKKSAFVFSAGRRALVLEKEGKKAAISRRGKKKGGSSISSASEQRVEGRSNYLRGSARFYRKDKERRVARASPEGTIGLSSPQGEKNSTLK